MATIAGRKIRTGTIGWTRDSESRRRDSNMGGDARSTSVRVVLPSVMSSTQAIVRSYNSTRPGRPAAQRPLRGLREGRGDTGDGALSALLGSAGRSGLAGVLGWGG